MRSCGPVSSSGAPARSPDSPPRPEAAQAGLVFFLRPCWPLQTQGFGSHPVTLRRVLTSELRPANNIIDGWDRVVVCNELATIGTHDSFHACTSLSHRLSWRRKTATTQCSASRRSILSPRFWSEPRVSTLVPVLLTDLRAVQRAERDRRLYDAALRLLVSKPLLGSTSDPCSLLPHVGRF